MTGVAVVAVLLAFAIQIATIGAALAQITQAPLSLSTSASLTDGGTTTLTASGGSGTGAVTYAITSGTSYCSLTNATLGGIGGSGGCRVTATKAGDGTYAAATADLFVFVQRADQLSIFPSIDATSIPVKATAALQTMGGSGGGAVTFAADDANCSVSGYVVTALAGPSCRIKVTKAGDGNYNAVTGIGSIKLTPIDQAALTVVLSGPLTTVGDTVTVSASGGSGTGAVSFYVSNSTGCTLSGTTVTATKLGNCNVVAHKAGDASYTPIDGITYRSIDYKLNQTPLTATLTKGSFGLSETSDVTFGGGSGTGALTYSAGPSPICRLSGTTVIPVSVGTCEITANKAADSGYYAA